MDGVVQVGEFNVDRHQRGEVAEGLLADGALGPGVAVHFALRVGLAPCHRRQNARRFSAGSAPLRKSLLRASQ